MKIYYPVIIISKNLHFKYIQLMMYMIFIIDHIHHLMNESKMLIFAYIVPNYFHFWVNTIF